MKYYILTIIHGYCGFEIEKKYLFCAENKEELGNKIYGHFSDFLLDVPKKPEDIDFYNRVTGLKFISFSNIEEIPLSEYKVLSKYMTVGRDSEP